MSKIVSFRLGETLITKAIEKLKLKEDDYREFTKQLNNTAYSLMVGWLTDDRKQDKDLTRLVDMIECLTDKVDSLESSLDSQPKPASDYEELRRERDRLEDRVSELLNQVDALKLEIKDLTSN